MAKLLKLRRGTTTQHGSFTGAEGEVTVDTDKETLVVHDGSTAGGHPVAAEDMANVSGADIKGRLATTLTNAEIKSDAAIAGTKISPDFGSQEVTTTGFFTSSGGLKIENTAPTIFLRDTNDNPDFRIMNSHGSYKIFDETNGVDRFVINPSGVLTVGGNSNFGAGVDVTGDITLSGKLDIGGSSGAAIEVPNNRRINLGNNGEFFLVHSANYSQIKETGSDNLYIDASHIRLRDENSQDKLQTTASGITVSGHIAVTGTVDGRDVATDGTKLDGIESGATADQTNAEIAAALSDQRPSMKGATFTDDGTGSPIVKIRADDTSPWGLQVANDSYWNNDSNGFKIYQDNSGNIDHRVTGNSEYVNYYIKTQSGSTSNTAILIDTSRAVHLYYQNNNKLSTTNAGVSVTGSMTASGNVTAFSDAKLKTDINTINDALGIVGKLRGVSYKWLSNNESDIGVIAQEVETVVPEVVKETEEGIKSVDYGRLVSVLINAINELKAEVDELKGGE